MVKSMNLLQTLKKNNALMMLLLVKLNYLRKFQVKILYHASRFHTLLWDLATPVRNM